MRIHVSLLAFCVALAGCKSSVDSANIDTVMVYSIPTAAAVRVNGDAVGRTPTTIKLDRTKNYELQVGKGGYLTETSELKPRLITTSEGIEFGFPAAVKVNLTKIPAEGEAGVPAADNPEFRRLSKKALGEEAAAKESLQSDIAATKEAAVKIQAALAAREAAAQAALEAARTEEEQEHAFTAASAADRAHEKIETIRTSTRTEAGTASMRRVWVGEIVDLDAVDLEALRPYLDKSALEKAVRGAVRAGARKIAGVDIFEQASAVVR